MPGLLKLNPDVLELPKPALRLPEGLSVVPNPNVEAPVVPHPKPELVPNPPRFEEPKPLGCKAVPMPEPNGVPKLTPRDGGGPGMEKNGENKFALLFQDQSSFMRLFLS